MKDLKIIKNKGSEFILRLEDEVIFCKPLSHVDIMDVMAQLCKSCEIAAGDSTLSLYKLIEDIIDELRAEEAEELMNRKFYSNVA